MDGREKLLTAMLLDPVRHADTTQNTGGVKPLEIRHDGFMEAVRQRRAELPERAVLATYLVLALAPFLFAATHSSFWSQHSRAPLVTALELALLLGLALHRRGAWAVLVFFDALVVISYSWEWAGVLGFVLNLGALAILLSPPMRRYVRLGAPQSSLDR